MDFAGNYFQSPDDPSLEDMLRSYWSITPDFCGTWAILPEEKVVFVGDAVLKNQLLSWPGQICLPGWRL